MKKVLSSTIIFFTAFAVMMSPVIVAAAEGDFDEPLPQDGTLMTASGSSNTQVQDPSYDGPDVVAGMAAAAQGTQGAPLSLPQAEAGSQAQSFTSAQTTASPAGTVADPTAAIMSGSKCSAGTILSSLITSSIGSSIGNLASKGVSTATDNLLNVPTVARGYPANQQLAETYRTVGATDPTGTTLVSASFNAIAWCIVNTMIQYITQATIQWAKTGFNGNPAFIENPEQFFKGIADQQAGKFIQDLVSGQTGINICAPFRNLIGISLAQNYSSGYAQRSSCSLSSIGTTFSQGNYMNDWLNVSQNQSNHPTGAFLQANNELARLTLSKTSTAQTSLNWNRGYLNFQTCSKPGDDRSCKTTTPGSLIQSSLEQTLGIPKNRLVIAQSFDQLVSTLVNSLISVALNKVLDSSNGSSSH